MATSFWVLFPPEPSTSISVPSLLTIAAAAGAHAQSAKRPMSFLDLMNVKNVGTRSPRRYTSREWPPCSFTTRASSSIATPDMICPDVQKPHWKPLYSMKAA